MIIFGIEIDERQLMDEMVRFDPDNSNCIQVIRKGKIVNTIVCPPINKGCDVINISNKPLEGYVYNFDGIVIVTDEYSRKMFYKGSFIDKIKRHGFRTAR
jgi:hypothetical protein